MDAYTQAELILVCIHTFLSSVQSEAANVYRHTQVCIHTYIHTYTCMHKCLHSYMNGCIRVQAEVIRVGIQTFLSSYASEATQTCFDCSVRACYTMQMSAAVGNGIVTGDIMEECEFAAARHCKLDAAEETQR
jgi:hypothetical protein